MKLLPYLARFDTGYSGFTGTETDSNVSVFSWILPDLIDLLRSQRGAPMGFTLGHCAMEMLILGVLLFRSIFQIAQTIVMRISIEVAGLHPFGTRASKCQQYQTMDRHLPQLNSNGDFQVITGCCAFQDAPLPSLVNPIPTGNPLFQRSYPPLIASFVSVVAGYSLPSLGHGAVYHTDICESN